MKIFGAPLSPYVARVMLACKYKGINYKLEMPEGGIKSEEYLKINPFGKIPALKDKEYVLFESSVIIHYLEKKYQQKKLLKGNPSNIAKANLISSISDLYIQTPVLELFRQTVGWNKKDKTIYATALTELEKGLDSLNRFISAKPFSSGKSFSMSDCFAIPALLFVTGVAPYTGSKNILNGRPKIKKYWSEMKKNHISKEQIDTMKARMDQLMNKN